MVRGIVLACVAGLLTVVGSASALEVKHPYFYTWEPTGVTCGDRDTIRVPLASKYSIVRIRTKVGDPMRDNATWLTTARIVRIERLGRPTTVVRFTAEGSDDTCTNPDRYLIDGWRAWHTLRIDTLERVPVYMAGYGNWKPKRPSAVYFGASQRIHTIRWTSWGDRVARGRGIYPTSDCVPNCAEGTITQRTVSVRASHPQWCKGRMRYLVLKYTFLDSALPDGTVKFGYACGLGPNSP